MKKHRKLGVVVLAIGALVPIAIDYITRKVLLRRRLAKIEADTKADYVAMQKAKETVQFMIESGYYQDKTTKEIESDFYFYHIAARFDE